MPRRKNAILLTLILSGEVIFFLPFVLARIFRPSLLLVFEITNLELGTFFSIYGLVAMGSYFFGGPLADRFPARNLISIALVLTALGGIILYLFPFSMMLAVMYAFWGVTSIFLFWAALIKATREWGGSGFQGRSFGFLEGGRGLAAALIGTLALGIFSYSMEPDAVQSITIKRIESFRLVILATSLITLFTGVLAFLVIPARLADNDSLEKLPGIGLFLQLLKKPDIYLQALIIVSAYVGYKITDDISLYAQQVLNLNEVQAASTGSAALWLRPLFAVIAGLLADRFSGTKVLIYCFLLMSFGSITIALGAFTGVLVMVLITLASTLAGVYGMRGVYFALMEDTRIPLQHTGAAVGIISLIGFTPDIFMGPTMGFLLDNYPGESGHQCIFAMMTAFALIGLISSLLLGRRIKVLSA
ncbi:MAG: MFS transporter [Vicingaceae bacterium]